MIKAQREIKRNMACLSQTQMPRLNGKVERSHRTDDLEFYQLLSYVDDVDLNKKLEEWEKFYNFDRPHKSLKGKTPFEILREKLAHGTAVSCKN